MNSEQLRLFISGAFGSEAEAREIVKLLRPDLARALVQVRGIVETLPDDSLARQREWRQKLPQIEEVMRPYNDAFAVTLSEELPKDGLRAAEETTLQLKSVAPRVAGFVEPAAIMADSTKFLLKTKVNERRVLGLFISEEVDKPSPFTKSLRKRIDQIVTGGIIEGKSTAAIAELLEKQLPQRLQSEAHALARTAIQDYNRQVKEAVWEANDESFADSGLAYEWVAALDSRTCPTCAPLDGAVKPKYRDFPKTPVHVNCRCQVVLVDPEDSGRVRYGQEAMTEKPTGEGAYKSKNKVKGERLYRRKREVKTVDGKSPRYADFLASADRKTQEMFFGGGKPGEERARRFRQAINNGTSADKALRELTDRVNKTAKVNTPEGVNRRFVSNK
jgi:SPP1 gp7 family putative phage head morphogenesis protein